MRRLPNAIRLYILRRRPHIAAVLSFLAVLGVAAACTGKWFFDANGYNTYALQADAWLHGRLDLGQDYPWLELAIYEGRYYVSFPPFPSYVLLPFALFMGTATPDGLICLMFSVLGLWTAVRIALDTGADERTAVFLALFLFLGTGYLFIALTPGVWFMAQVMCFNLSLLSLYCALKGRGFLALLWWSCAVGCRPMVIFFLPLLIMLLWRAHREAHPRDTALTVLRRRACWILPPLVIGGSYMALNYLRFHDILEFGHNYLPEFTRAEYGQFSLTYLMGNLRTLFRLPTRAADGRLVIQPFDGAFFPLIDPMCLPILYTLIRALFKKRPADRRLSALTLLSALIYLLVLCSHRTLGGWQFGNRYLKDIMPWLFTGYLLLREKGGRVGWTLIPLFLLGLSVSLTGTVITYNYWY